MLFRLGLVDEVKESEMPKNKSIRLRIALAIFPRCISIHLRIYYIWSGN
jgi:hypothetical protein